MSDHTAPDAATKATDALVSRPEASNGPLDVESSDRPSGGHTEARLPCGYQCATRGWCHRCSPHLQVTDGHVQRAVLKSGLPPEQRGEVHERIMRILLGAPAVHEWAVEGRAGGQSRQMTSWTADRAKADARLEHYRAAGQPVTYRLIRRTTTVTVRPEEDW